MMMSTARQGGLVWACRAPSCTIRSPLLARRTRPVPQAKGPRPWLPHAVFAAHALPQERAAGWEDLMAAQRRETLSKAIMAAR
jgi:hypothetical protein